MDAESTATNAGNAGNLTLQAKNIQFSQGAQLSAKTIGAGQGGSVSLTATGNLTFEGNNNNNEETPSGIFVRSESQELNAGDGGNVQIQATDISFADGAKIEAKTLGTGQGGSVVLKASNQIDFQDSRIEAETTGSGQAGSVNLQATQSIQLTGEGTELRSFSQGTGTAGNLRLETPQLTLNHRATINSAAKASGNAGRIELVLDQLSMKNTASLTTSTSNTGHAGGLSAAGKPLGLGIFIDAQRLTLESGASISSESLSTGAGGNAGLVQINLSDSLNMSGGSAIRTSTAGQGDAGNIIIGQKAKPVTLWVADRSTIASGSSSTAAGAGQAGSLKILAGEIIHIQGDSAFTTASKNAGGGGIHIETRNRLRLQDSKITTSVAGGEGQGGNIFIDPIFIMLKNSQIQANAHGGPGGNITLIADYLLKSGPTTIEASSALSTPGDVDVQAVDVDGGSFQAAAAVDPLDVAQWQKIPCNLRRGKISRLIITGYDAHPTPVDDLLSSLPIWAQMPLDTSDKYSLKPIEPVAATTKPSAFQKIPLTMLQGYNLAAVDSSIGTCD